MGLDDSADSLFRFVEYLRFYRPKTIAFDLLEEDYLVKYDEFVRGKNFRKEMQEIEKAIERKDNDRISELSTFKRSQSVGSSLSFYFSPLLHI